MQMLVFVSASTLGYQYRHLWSWRPLRFACNHPCRLRSWRPRPCVPRQVTFGSVGTGVGATTIGPGRVGTGVRRFAGATAFMARETDIGIMGYGPNAMKVSVADSMGSTVAAKR